MAGSPSTAPGRGVRQPLLAVEVAGHGDHLVLLHGLGTTRMIWEPVRALLARERRVVTVDLPGFGQSAAAGPGFDLEAVADRISRGLAAQGIRGPFDLVGHSLGAGVALALAAHRPQSVRRLVLVAPAGLHRPLPAPLGLLGPGAEALFAVRRRLAPLAELPAGRRVLLAFAAADPAGIPPSQARAMIEASAGAARLGAAFAAIATADLRPLLAQVKVPLGLIWGEHDRTVPVRVASAITALRPETRLELISGAGHVPMVERPAVFVAALQRLCDGLPKYATTSASSGT